MLRAILGSVRLIENYHVLDQPYPVTRRVIAEVELRPRFTASRKNARDNEELPAALDGM